jgi:hypothetical protein
MGTNPWLKVAFKCLGYCFLAIIVFATGLTIAAIVFPDSKDAGQGASPAAADTNDEGPSNEKVVSAGNFVACRDRAYVEKLLTYSVDRDEVAFARGVNFGRATGECFVLKAGDAYLIDDSTMSGFIQIRRRGESNTYWTLNNALK